MSHLSHGPANRGRRVLQNAAPLFVCEPDGPPRGGAVVLHDVFGMTEDTDDACRTLARDGLLTVAPFLYHERGGPAFERAALDAARAQMARLRPDDIAADIAGALSYLAARGVERPAVVGFGAGGHLAAWTAARHGVSAAVSVDADERDEAPPLPVDPAPSRRIPFLALSSRNETALWKGIRAFLR